MAYPAKLLSPGETIKFEMKPHWRGLIWPAIVLILDVGVFVFLYSLIDNPILRWIFLALFLLVLLMWAVLPLMRWLSTQYVFTDRRIIIRRGILTKQGRDVPLAKVNNVSFNKSVLGRILNFGELQIESANVDGSLYISDVPDVEEIQRDIYRLQEEDDARRRGAAGSHGDA